MLSEVGNKISEIRQKLRGNIHSDMVNRGLNATGRTSASIRTNTLEGPQFVSGTLYANDNWEFVGSGRKPGKQPPISPLKTWIEARGLDMNPYALAKSISEKGTKDFRQKNKNVFLDNIEKMRGSGEFSVIREFARDAMKEIVPTFKTLSRA